MKIRDRLLLAAERQFAEHGAVETTLGQIRDAAGASVGALYHHFPDKAELYRQVWTNALADYQRHLWQVVGDSTDARAGIEGGVIEHLRWVAENQYRAKVLTSARPPGVRESESNREFLRNVWRWWRTHAGYGTVRDLEFDLVYALWLGPAQEYARHWLGGEIVTAPTDIAPVLADAAWQALRAPRPDDKKADR
ncbi:TetR family transcriptional regulator [Nocardia sp. CDC159]|uniref:TetR family transcriptional regulator n=1 Tax=Nocardia pulmonis TaxID=2951408 RepID=A0A9X2EDA6_9NOCA|nr:MULTISPECIES: TetR/AcrR family transcriptional regulator [Nocardia]MCM6777033.1 TetR family transcriptional regulator [Nocardia pulmonis]MCM6789457.1 TetR family transcriptional regulator [Nocardia sp. CDC159]